MALQQEFIWHRQKLYPHFYLCHYRPVAAGKDNLSHSLLRFKVGTQPDLTGWIDCSLEMLAHLQFPPGSLILRALHHHETTLTAPSVTTPTSLDLLAQSLASQFDSNYCPHLLKKSAPSQPLKTFSRSRRELELQNKYGIHPDQIQLLQSAPAILLIDDILTTGATIGAILDTIDSGWQTLPAQIGREHPNISVFTLAKTTPDTSPHHPDSIKGRHFLLTQDTNWTVAEPPAPYKTTPHPAQPLSSDSSEPAQPESSDAPKSAQSQPSDPLKSAQTPSFAPGSPHPLPPDNSEPPPPTETPLFHPTLPQLKSLIKSDAFN